MQEYCYLSYRGYKEEIYKVRLKSDFFVTNRTTGITNYKRIDWILVETLGSSFKPFVLHSVLLLDDDGQLIREFHVKPSNRRLVSYPCISLVRFEPGDFTDTCPSIDKIYFPFKY